MRNTVNLIARVVAAVFLAATTVLGWVALLILDTRDILDTVSVWGWTWFQLLFAVLSISFWIVVVSLYLSLRKYEKKQPNLHLVPISYAGDNIAYIETYNKGGYVPNCIANVKSLSAVTIRDKEVRLEYLRNQSAILRWDSLERVSNIPNDNVRRRLRVAQLFSGGWRFSDFQGTNYPVGWYKVDVVLSFEAETAYTKTISVALECKYDVGKGILNIFTWEQWSKQTG